MRKLLMTSALALALASTGAAVSAQINAGDQTPTGVASEPPAAMQMSPQQRSSYDGWPADRRTDYDAWPGELQTYFWTLTPSQQEGWFALNDAQRQQVYGMPPASRTAAWASIERQLAGAPPPNAAGAAMNHSMHDNMHNSMQHETDATQLQANPRGSMAPATAMPPNPATASSSVRPATPADPSYQAGPYKGALTAPPDSAMNKTYPVCTRQLQDSCRNPGGV